MLRQALIIPSRALRSTARSISQKPLSRPQSYVTPIAVRKIQPSAARWYSDASHSAPSQSAPAEEGKDAETNSEGENKESAGPAEDPALAECRKQLEAKEKETADWKVGRALAQNCS